MRKSISKSLPKFVGALALSVVLSAVAGAGEGLDPDVLNHHMLDNDLLNHHMLDNDVLDHDKVGKSLRLISADPADAFEFDTASASGGLTNNGPAGAPKPAGALKTVQASTVVGLANSDPVGAPAPAINPGPAAVAVTAAAPEIDPASAIGALTLLGAGLTIIRGRRIRK